MTKMQCTAMEPKLAELLLDAEKVPAEVRSHVQTHLDGCPHCRAELESLWATLVLLDDWRAPEPSPYFLTRLGARLEEERRMEPQGWLARLRGRFTHRFAYGAAGHAKPLAATAFTILLLVGGGAYMSVTDQDRAAIPVGPEAAVVADLQTLDNNAQVLDQLEMLSDNSDDPEGN